MWGWVIVGGAVCGLVLLVLWSLLEMAARGDAAMARIMVDLENQETTHEA